MKIVLWIILFVVCALVSVILFFGSITGSGNSDLLTGAGLVIGFPFFALIIYIIYKATKTDAATSNVSTNNASTNNASTNNVSTSNASPDNTINDHSVNKNTQQQQDPLNAENKE